MNEHSRYSRHGRRDGWDQGKMDGPTYYGQSVTRRKLPLAIVLIGLVVWSLLAWTGYVLVDPLLGWVAASAGLLLDTGKNLANITGAGKELGTLVDGLNVSGIAGQAVALLHLVLKPAIVVGWAVGALALMAAPVILPRLMRLLATHRR